MEQRKKERKKGDSKSLEFDVDIKAKEAKVEKEGIFTPLVNKKKEV